MQGFSFGSRNVFYFYFVRCLSKVTTDRCPTAPIKVSGVILRSLLSKKDPRSLLPPFFETFITPELYKKWRLTGVHSYSLSCPLQVILSGNLRISPRAEAIMNARKSSSNSIDSLTKLLSTYLVLLIGASSLFLLSACGGEGEDGNSLYGDVDGREKIVNGVEIPDNKLPSIARLAYIGAGIEPELFCTGTFINPYQVLTAGHCILSEPANGGFSVGRMGVELRPGVFTPAIAAVVHPEFRLQRRLSRELSDTIYVPGDLGIITVAEPYDGPVAAISTEIPVPGQSLLLAGFGRVHSEADDSEILRIGEVQADYISMQDKILYWMFDGMHESNTCHGDSGGPAFTQFYPDQPFVMVGVTSGGYPNCEPNSYSFDTLISHPIYLDWILQITEGNLQLL
jgi:hypothetical protein